MLPEATYPLCIVNRSRTLQSLGSPINSLNTLQCRVAFAVPELISNARHLFREELFQLCIRVARRHCDFGGHLFDRLETHADVKPIEYALRWLLCRSIHKIAQPIGSVCSTLTFDSGVQPLASSAAFMKSFAMHKRCWGTQAK